MASEWVEVQDVPGRSVVLRCGRCCWTIRVSRENAIKYANAALIDHAECVELFEPVVEPVVEWLKGQTDGQ